MMMNASFLDEAPPENVMHTLVDSSDVSWMSSLTETQEKWIMLLPIIPSVLSFMGSGMIIYLIVGRKDSAYYLFGVPSSSSPSSHTASASSVKDTYKRLLLGMSICDCWTSLTVPLQPFLVPRGDPNAQRVWIWAIGNDATCTFVGFMTQFGFSGLLYNAMLSYYFWLSTRFRWTHKGLQRNLELPMHLLAVGYPLVTAAAGIAMNVFHQVEFGPGCWVADYPDSGCDPITRLCSVTIGGYVFGAVPVLFAFGSILINNLLLYWHVRRTLLQWEAQQRQASRSSRRDALRRTRSSDDLMISSQMVSSRMFTTRSAPPRTKSNDSTESIMSLSHMVSSRMFTTRDASTPISTTNRESSIEGSGNVATAGSPAEPEVTASRLPRRADPRDRLAEMRLQSSLYVLGLLVTYGSSTVVKFVDTYGGKPEDEADWFWLLCLHVLCIPSQGISNFLIFCRPNYVRARQRYPQETRLQAIRRAMMLPSSSRVSANGKEDGLDFRPSKSQSRSSRKSRSSESRHTHSQAHSQHHQQQQLSVMAGSSDSVSEETNSSTLSPTPQQLQYERENDVVSIAPTSEAEVTLDSVDVMESGKETTMVGHDSMGTIVA